MVRQFSFDLVIQAAVYEVALGQRITPKLYGVLRLLVSGALVVSSQWKFVPPPN
jgi:hypothetical protein